MKHLVIIGGGFAGLWAAFSAVRQARVLNKQDKLTITLINKTPYHELRPRFYEEALDNTRLCLKEYLQPLGVSLVIAEVILIDTENQRISLSSDTILHYHQLIIAAGSKLIIPDIPGLLEYAYDIDSFAAAKKLQQHIAALPNQESFPGQYTIVVAGGGFTGVEAATDLMDRIKKMTPRQEKHRVIILDRSDVAGAFSTEARNVILKAFSDLGIETLPNTQITEVFQNAVKLSNSTIIPTATVVWTAGMQSNGLTKQISKNLDSFGRLPVDRYLQVKGIKNCLAAGDVAAATTDGEHMALLSCQHAMPQGRFAGHNAVARLFADELLMYEQPKFVTCLDLGSWGALYCEGWQQQVISTKADAKKIKRFINQERIYPPDIQKEGVDVLLSASEPVFKPIAI